MVELVDPREHTKSRAEGRTFRQGPRFPFQFPSVLPSRRRRARLPIVALVLGLGALGGALFVAPSARAQTTDPSVSTPSPEADPSADAPDAAAPSTEPLPAPAPLVAPTDPPPPSEDDEKLIPVGEGDEFAVDTSKRPVAEEPEARADRPVRSPLMKRLMRPRLTYDINLEGGVGYVFSSPTRWNGLARGGVGVTWVKDPFWNTLRLTYEYSGLADATFGAQVEMAWFERGLWAQVGGLYDFKGPGHGGVMAALGFAIFGVEGEYRGAEPTGKAWAIYLKARLPVSAILQAITE